MEYSNCKSTDQASTIWDHGIKVTRFDKHIDNMHVSVESRTPPKGASAFTSNYKIEIQENNMQDIDVTIRMDNRGINVNAPSNFSRSKTQSEEMTENRNADKRSRNEYQINYASEQQNKSKEKFYHERYWDTKHVIRITDCPTNHSYDIQQGFARENFTQNNYTNSSSSENGRIRVFEEKEFGSVAKNGKIVKTNIESRTSLLDDSVNNFTINESIHSSLEKNKFENANTAIKFNDQSQLRDSHNIDNLILEEGVPEVPKISHKKGTEIEQKDQLQPPSSVSFKSMINKDKKPGEEGISVQTPKGDKKNQILLTPETSLRNKNSHSPAVYDYDKEDIIPSDDENDGPAEVKRPIKVTKPKLLLKTGESHPPSPTIEKSIQKYFNNLNYSMNSSKKHFDKSFNRINKNESPLSVGPSSRQIQSKQKGKDKDGINLSQKVEMVDTFTVNKNKYLDKLRREEKSRSRMSQSRTLSRSKHSLSPECQAITDRLYYTKINKQPCPKFVKYQDAMQRSKIKDTLQNYTFISKYLSDHEIYDIMVELQESNVPEKKWALKLVDIVYDKLKVIKAY